MYEYLVCNNEIFLNITDHYNTGFIAYIPTSLNLTELNKKRFEDWDRNLAINCPWTWPKLQVIKLKMKKLIYLFTNSLRKTLDNTCSGVSLRRFHIELCSLQGKTISHAWTLLIGVKTKFLFCIIKLLDTFLQMVTFFI